MGEESTVLCSVIEWCEVLLVIILLNQTNCPDGAMSVTKVFLVTDSIAIVQIHLESSFGQHCGYDNSQAATSGLNAILIQKLLI